MNHLLNIYKLVMPKKKIEEEVKPSKTIIAPLPEQVTLSSLEDKVREIIKYLNE